MYIIILKQTKKGEKTWDITKEGLNRRRRQSQEGS